jgi:hypothetical protein
VNDNTYERDLEVFSLVLGNPVSVAAGLASVGRQKSTTIRINDDSDSKIFRSWMSDPHCHSSHMKLLLYLCFTSFQSP